MGKLIHVDFPSQRRNGERMRSAKPRPAPIRKAGNNATLPMIQRYLENAGRANNTLCAFQNGQGPRNSKASGQRYSKMEILERLESISKDPHLQKKERWKLNAFLSGLRVLCPTQTELGQIPKREKIAKANSLLSKTNKYVEGICHRLRVVERNVEEFEEIMKKIFCLQEELGQLDSTIGKLIKGAGEVGRIDDPRLRNALADYYHELMNRKPDIDLLRDSCNERLRFFMHGQKKVRINSSRVAGSPERNQDLVQAISLHQAYSVRLERLVVLGKKIREAMVREGEA